MYHSVSWEILEIESLLWLESAVYDKNKEILISTWYLHALF